MNEEPLPGMPPAPDPDPDHADGHTYRIGNHYAWSFKVGSQFQWVDCTICQPGPTEEIKGTWPIIPNERRNFPEQDGEIVSALTLFSCLETHTLWHKQKGEYVDGIQPV